MRKWSLGVKHIEYQNRYVECILEGTRIIVEVENLNPRFVSEIIEAHNKAVSDAYKEGSDETKRICKEVYGKRD